MLCHYVVPLLALLFSQPPSIIIEQLTDPAVVSTATTSLTGASISTTLGALFGLPLAYWLARVNGRLQTLVTAFVVLPPIVSGMVLLTVVGLNTALRSVAAANGLPLTGSLTGVVLAQSFVASPFVVVTAKAVFKGVDRRLEDASRSLGESRMSTFWRVTFPLAWLGIAASVTLAFARLLGEFGATIMLAYYPRRISVQI